MYQMPGEVLNGERPGLFGMNLFQLFGAMAGFFIGAYFDNTIIVIACTVAGLILASRNRGLYVAEYWFYRLRWSILAGIARARGDADTSILDPIRLYARTATDKHGVMYIVETPDGQAIMISRQA